MPTIKITDAAIEPITLAEAKLHLRVDASDDDARIGGFIAAVRQECEVILGRSLIETTWELVRDDFPDALRLDVPRVLSVEWVKYIDVNGAQQTLNPADYVLDDASEPAYVVPAYGKTWPGTRDEINAVRVRFKAGYGTTAAAVPAVIKAWLLERLEQVYRGIAAETGESMRSHPALDASRVWA